MRTHQLVIALFVFSSLGVGGDASGEGCNGEDHGISCCYKGFSIGDNDNKGKEVFIQANQYNIGCFESCKKLQPGSIGITVSVNQKYQSGKGKGRNKCWCEFSGKSTLDAANTNYRTCVFNIPSALALAKEDPAVIECTATDGSWFGPEGGRIKAFPRIRIGEKINITMSIEPANLTGLLLAVRGPKDYCVLELVNGEVVFRVENGKGVITMRHKPNQPLDDGNFHKINAIKVGNVITMKVDNTWAEPSSGTPGITSLDTNNPLFLGSHPRPDLIPNYPGNFQGCIKHVFIDNKLDNTDNQIIVTSDMVYGDVGINVKIDDYSYSV